MANHAMCYTEVIKDATDRQPRDEWLESHEGWKSGDLAIRSWDPRVGVIEHVCRSKWRRDTPVYAYVLWPNGGRRGDKIFDTHSHVPLSDLRRASPENIDQARERARKRVESAARRLGFLGPMEYV